MKTKYFEPPSGIAVIRSLVICLIAAVMAIFFTSCGTIQGQPPITPERAGQIARLAAFGSASGLLIEKPQSKADLEKARTILVAVVAGKQWDVAQLGFAFQQAGFSVLKGEKGVLIITGAILAADLTGRTVDLKQSAYAEAAITGALDGLNLALGH